MFVVQSENPAKPAVADPLSEIRQYLRNPVLTEAGEIEPAPFLQFFKKLNGLLTSIKMPSVDVDTDEDRLATYQIWDVVKQLQSKGSGLNVFTYQDLHKLWVYVEGLQRKESQSEIPHRGGGVEQPGGPAGESEESKEIERMRTYTKLIAFLNLLGLAKNNPKILTSLFGKTPNDNQAFGFEGYFFILGKGENTRAQGRFPGINNITETDWNQWIQEEVELRDQERRDEAEEFFKNQLPQNTVGSLFDGLSNDLQNHLIGTRLQGSEEQLIKALVDLMNNIYNVVSDVFKTINVIDILEGEGKNFPWDNLEAIQALTRLFDAFGLEEEGSRLFTSAQVNEILDYLGKSFPWDDPAVVSRLEGFVQGLMEERDGQALYEPDQIGGILDSKRFLWGNAEVIGQLQGFLTELRRDESGEELFTSAQAVEILDSLGESFPWDDADAISRLKEFVQGLMEERDGQALYKPEEIVGIFRRSSGFPWSDARAIDQLQNFLTGLRRDESGEELFTSAQAVEILDSLGESFPWDDPAAISRLKAFVQGLMEERDGQALYEPSQIIGTFRREMLTRGHDAITGENVREVLEKIIVRYELERATEIRLEDESKLYSLFVYDFSPEQKTALVRMALRLGENGPEYVSQLICAGFYAGFSDTENQFLMKKCENCDLSSIEALITFLADLGKRLEDRPIFYSWEILQILQLPRFPLNDTEAITRFKDFLKKFKEKGGDITGLLAVISSCPNTFFKVLEECADQLEFLAQIIRGWQTQHTDVQVVLLMQAVEFTRPQDLSAVVGVQPGRSLTPQPEPLDITPLRSQSGSNLSSTASFSSTMAILFGLGQSTLSGTSSGQSQNSQGESSRKPKRTKPETVERVAKRVFKDMVRGELETAPEGTKYKIRVVSVTDCYSLCGRGQPRRMVSVQKIPKSWWKRLWDSLRGRDWEIGLTNVDLQRKARDSVGFFSEHSKGSGLISDTQHFWPSNIPIKAS